MATVVKIGEPVNDAERQAIAWLRDHLPGNYTVFHNFEIHRDGERFEVDLAVLAPHALYLVDVKGTRGLIDVYGSKWYPEGRQPFTSPLLKLRGHARSFKGLLTESQPGRSDLGRVYVGATILLTAPNAHLVDQGGRDKDDVTTLKKAASYFQNASLVPGRFDKNITRVSRMVESALVGAARKPKGPLVLGDWQVIEKLGGTDTCTEHRAVHTIAGKRGGTVLLRVYKADPYLPEAEREQQRARISNAFTALNRLPGHPCIVGARTFFPTEGEQEFVLVTEDPAGQALRLHIDKPALALTLDQKLRVARELMEALAFCHAHEVVHRNLTPGTILLGSDGHIRLTGFDHARAGTDRSHTIAREIVDEIDPAYTAPEAYREPELASAASDVFSAGLVLYELFSGDRAFGSPTELFDQSGVFAVKPSAHRAELTPALDGWLQRLCTFDPAGRPTAQAAVDTLEAALAASAPPDSEPAPPPPTVAPEPAVVETDWINLPRGTLLAGKLEVQKRLGRGAFGVVYKVVDTLGDVSRALKLILRDRHSTLERLKKEYKTLVHLPEHPHVVRVIDANVLPGDGPPYMLFEYVDGEDLGDLIEDERFAPEDALVLFRQVAEGLVHLHREGLYHCDIKPHNLLWTVQGAKIIDFNVSVRSEDNGHGGGSRRYLPPDLDLTTPPTPSELVDRDVYALGLTVYESLTGGQYPWDATAPPPATHAPDPRERRGPSDLTPELVEVVRKAIAPRRAERFASAAALLEALEAIPRARREAPSESSDSLLVPELGGEVPPNTNPFVSYLATLYSQSSRTNAGTRGLDELGRRTYVPTLLDDSLLPAVLAGRFKLVVITGNAGDGKTAFLQQLETEAGTQAQLVSSEPMLNGARFATPDRTFLTNYDGSQDEDDRTNDEVLRAFFEPFSGDDPSSWPDAETRLIAINEGRLVDFLSHQATQFPALRKLVEEGLQTGADTDGVAVVNLNLRSVVADLPGVDGSILARQVRLLTEPKFWSACQSCDLKDRCYALHNAQTLQDRTAGPQVLERLETLYTLTHLRGQLHITLRDLRSALAYTLTSARDCGQIHALYADGRRDSIADGFYFNAWMGGDAATADRLLTLLRGVDVGEAGDPRMDRGLDFVSPNQDRSRFGFADRGAYDHEVLRAVYDHLPRDFSGKPTPHRVEAHRRYVAMARRRAFFERRDGGWRAMLPYRSADRMLRLVQGEERAEHALAEVLHAINRGEGLLDPERLSGSLALQVRQVERGTIRSYRLFDARSFALAVRDAASRARFVEHMPDALVLRFESEDNGNDAELVVNLDIFEMLERLNQGYRPSLEEEQGFYLSLAVFKNVLGSAPYQEVLLTTTGHDFYRVERHPNGRLAMDHMAQEVG